jgi:DNA polymerase-1
MVTLFDLGAEFWRNAHGGSEPMLGYEQTLERLDWYRRECPRFIVCADSPRSIRKEMHETYKANRKPKPQPAVEALQGVIERVRAWGLPLVQVDGWEADDVIATLTHQAWPEAVQIIGSEKDFFCLIDDERVFLVGKNGPIDGNACFDKFGVAPTQMLDWLALVGDAADGVEGCESCGPARASALLEKFDSLSGILAASDDDILAIPGVGKKTLAALRAWDPKKTFELLTMNCRLPIDLQEILRDK